MTISFAVKSFIIAAACRGSLAQFPDSPPIGIICPCESCCVDNPDPFPFCICGNGPCDEICTPTSCGFDCDLCCANNKPTGKCGACETAAQCKAACSMGALGEPHFTTWDKTHFDYQGECDLVLAQSPVFKSGAGFTVHIRTTGMTTGIEANQRVVSYISEMALNIGQDLFQVHGDGSYWLNGEKGEGLLMKGDNFEVGTMYRGKKKKMLEFTIKVNDGDKVFPIVVKANLSTGMLAVQMTETIADSVGLMGNTNGLGLLARDGKTDLKGGWDDFGQEWQVRPDVDGMLFQTVRAPQYPDPCSFTAKTEEMGAMTGSQIRRRLMAKKEITKDKAIEACAGVPEGRNKESCIFDVVAVGNVDAAEDYIY